MAWEYRQGFDCRCEKRGLSALVIAGWGLAICITGLSRPAQAAGGGGGASDSVILTTEALEESNQDAHPVSGRSEATFAPGRLSLSDFVLLSGPALNNLSGYVPGPPPPPTPSSASSGTHGGHHGGSAHAASVGGDVGGSSQRIPGYSMRDNIEAGYTISDRVGVGPVFGVDHRFYGNHSTSLGDPQIRASVKRVYEHAFNGFDVDAGTWVTYTVPTSGMSRAENSYGSLGVSFIPRLLIHGSRFFFSSVLGFNVSADGEPGHPLPFTPYRLTAGVQCNYRIARRWTYFLGNTESLTGGPTAPIVNPDDLPDPALAYQQDNNGNRFSHPYQFSTGVYFRASEGTSLSPRLSWQADQNISTTTFGFSANFTIL